MSADDVDAYTVQARKSSDKYRKKTDGQYLAIHLPDDIDRIGLERGDLVYVSLGSQQINGHEIWYLRVSEQEITRHSMKIRYRKDLYPRNFITVPIEYTFYRENQSFHGLNPGDDLNLELKFIDKEAWIYTAEDFRYRLSQIGQNGDVPPVIKQPSGGMSPRSAENPLDFHESEAEILHIPEDSVRAKESFGVIGRVYNSAPYEPEAVMFQFRKSGDTLWNVRDFHLKDTRIGILNDGNFAVDDYYKEGVLDREKFSFARPGEYEFRVFLKTKLRILKSDIHTVNVV